MTTAAFHRYSMHPEHAGVSAVHRAGAGVRTIDAEAADQQGWGRIARRYLPTGWPEQVRPLGALEWERRLPSGCSITAVGYRSYVVLQRHPVVLVRFAADFIEGQIGSTRVLLQHPRGSLRALVSPDVLDAAAVVLRTEEAYMLRARRDIALVEEALRGKVFIEKL